MRVTDKTSKQGKWNTTRASYLGSRWAARRTKRRDDGVKKRNTWAARTAWLDSVRCGTGGVGRLAWMEECKGQKLGCWLCVGHGPKVGVQFEKAIPLVGMATASPVSTRQPCFHHNPGVQPQQEYSSTKCKVFKNLGWGLGGGRGTNNQPASIRLGVLTSSPKQGTKLRGRVKSRIESTCRTLWLP